MQQLDLFNNFSAFTGSALEAIIRKLRHGAVARAPSSAQPPDRRREAERDGGIERAAGLAWTGTRRHHVK